MAERSLPRGRLRVAALSCAPPYTVTATRDKVRIAIAAIARSEVRWILTQKGRAAIRHAYRQGRSGEALSLGQCLCLPLVIFHQVGLTERRRTKAAAPDSPVSPEEVRARARAWLGSRR